MDLLGLKDMGRRAKNSSSLRLRILLKSLKVRPGNRGLTPWRTML